MNKTDFSWHKLYELAVEIARLQPWELFYESEIFGVVDPAGEEPLYVSIMGQGGEHRSVALYQGDFGLREFCFLKERESNLFEDPDARQLMLNMPHFQLEFNSSSEIHPAARKWLKKNNLWHRTRAGHPILQRYGPLLHPWLATDTETGARILAALQQVREVAEDARLGGEYPEFDPEDGVTPLLRGEDENGNLIWEEHEFNLFDSRHPNLPADPAAVERLLQLPQKNARLDLYFMAANEAVEEGGKNPSQPFFPGFLLGLCDQEEPPMQIAMMKKPPANLDALSRKLAELTEEILDKLGWRPTTIETYPHTLADAVRNLLENSQIKVEMGCAMLPEEIEESFPARPYACFTDRALEQEDVFEEARSELMMALEHYKKWKKVVNRLGKQYQLGEGQFIMLLELVQCFLSSACSLSSQQQTIEVEDIPWLIHHWMFEEIIEKRALPADFTRKVPEMFTQLLLNLDSAGKLADGAAMARQVQANAERFLREFSDKILWTETKKEIMKMADQGLLDLEDRREVLNESVRIEAEQQESEFDDDEDWDEDWWEENNDAAHTRDTSEKIGRNQPCPCGSGKKFKRCCG